MVTNFFPEEKEISVHDSHRRLLATRLCWFGLNKMDKMKNIGRLIL